MGHTGGMYVPLVLYVSEKYFVHLTVATVAFVTLAIQGPSYSNPTLISVLVSFINVFTLLLFLIGSYEGWKRLHLNFWFTHGLTILTANFLSILTDINLVLFVFSEGQMADTTFPVGTAITPALFANEYLSDLQYPAIFWSLSTGITVLLTRQKNRLISRATAETSVNVTGFLREMPSDWRERIDVVEAQENYICVFVGTESRTILYRFKDAVLELGDSVGLQVHRSFWVSKAAISKFTKTQSKGEIVTTSGKTIPVSRTYLKAVEKVVSANQATLIA